MLLPALEVEKKEGFMNFITNAVWTLFDLEGQMKSDWAMQRSLTGVVGDTGRTTRSHSGWGMLK